MSGGFLQGFSGDMAQHGSRTGANADVQETHRRHSEINTADLGSAWRGPAYQLNVEGHDMWSQGARLNGTELGHTQGDGVNRIANHYDNANVVTSGLMSKVLNPSA